MPDPPKSDPTKKEGQGESSGVQKPTFDEQLAQIRFGLNASFEEVEFVYNYLRKLDDPTSSTQTVKQNALGMLSRLDEANRDYEDAYKAIGKLYIANGRTGQFPAEADKKERSRNRSNYFNASGQIRALIAEDKKKSQMETFNTSFSEPTYSKSLPQLDLPEFDGDLTQWVKFRDSFTAMVHAENLPEIHKFRYLRSCLKGHALSTISSFKLEAANYQLAWQAVLDAYDNPRMHASAYLDQILSFKPLQGKGSSDSLAHFVHTIGDNITAFKSLKLRAEGDFVLFHLASRCLDSQSRELFEMSHPKDVFPTFGGLLAFVRDRMLSLQLASNINPVLERSSSEKAQKKFPKRPSPKDPKTSLMTNDSRSQNDSSNSKKSKAKGKAGTSPSAPTAQLPICAMCKSERHTLWSCATFIGSTPADRRSALQNWSGCTNCLSPRHQLGDCSSPRRCSVCQAKHHTLLHAENATSGAASSSAKSQTSVPTNLAAAVTAPSLVTLGTALAQIRNATGQWKSIRMVIDSGSQCSFLTSRCLTRLGLKMEKTNNAISGIGQTLFEGAKGKVCCVIKPRGSGGNQLTTDAVVVNTITSHLPASPLPQAIVDLFKGFRLADPTFWKPGPVDFLLGADLFTDILTGGTQPVGKGAPDLLPSVFGLIVMGRMSCEENIANSTSLLMVDQAENLNFQLERFWELEQPTSIAETADPQDLECEEHFLQTHSRLPSGRYVVRLPFRSGNPDLGDSAPAALRRFYCLERRLNRDPALKKMYHDFMMEYIELGHMSPATSEPRYLIPHHAIIKESSEGAKLKAVFDASATAPNGSLNSHLLTGQKLQNDVRSVVTRFRHHRYVFSTDIVKMFRMIEVAQEDRKYLQIFWRFDSSKPVQRFELNTVIYGLVCAPFLAQRVLRQLAEDHGKEFPLAAHALLNDSYVDDILTGASTLADAVELKKQLVQLLKCGGFDLSKWKTNTPQLLDNDTTYSAPIDLSTPEENWVKVLGLQWDPQSDSFSFSIGETNPNQTKRGVLSTLARLYDPLGFLTPLTFSMKKFVQDLWIAGYSWDQELAQVLINSWKTIVEELPLIGELRIPRCLTPSDQPTSSQLVGFADASSRGYAAILFLRVSYPSGCRISLLAAKSKLAPTNTQTIPRLELSGALLLAELYAAVLPDLQFDNLDQEEPVFFTDSTIVLAWINTSAHKLKVFVANRVSKINELTAPLSWRHVISEENPADIGSRGAHPSSLLKNDLWWSGPSWITSPSAQWPTYNPVLPNDVPELKTLQVLTSKCPVNPLISWISRFSIYTHLIKSAGWLQRWLFNLKHQRGDASKFISGNLSASEIDKGLAMCVKATQAHYFQDKSKMLREYGDLRPYVDGEGVWRVGGRLEHSSLPADEKHPILLPHQAHLSALLVDHYHRAYLHPGPTVLQAVIQHRYWIPSLRRLIRLRGFRCKPCYNSRTATVAPIMGNLPSHRVNGGRTFQHVGIDFAGPFSLKESTRRNAALGKVYLCLYVCMATKAVHLEAVTRLTTEAFLASFKRFTARRGLPTDVYTDNGSNFLGAANYLKDLYRWFTDPPTKQDLLDYATATKIAWHFNPPHTPHMGGIWEAGVKSVKRYLKIIADGHNMTYEELATWLAQIEAILNSRPLCPLSTDPGERDYLSPGHFLVGGPLVLAPEQSLLDSNESLLGRWQRVNRLSEEFWRRWSTEYLKTLQRRPKWIKSKKNLEIGDLVLLKEPSPPLQWKLARVIATHPGSDDVVRVVTVQRGNSTFCRHVVNLVPLPHLSEPSFQACQEDGNQPNSS